MALVKKRSNSTRTVIIISVILVVLSIGYFLFQEFFINSAGDEANANSVNRSRSVITNFGESILNDSRFINLQPYGSTVNADANVDGGQDNPFR